MKYDEVVGDMVRQVTADKRMACCKGDVKRKCLRRLIKHFALDATVKVIGGAGLLLQGLRWECGEAQVALR